MDGHLSDNKSDNNGDRLDNNGGDSDNESDNTERLLGLIAENPGITQAQLAEQLGIARSTVAIRLADLQRNGVVRRVGARKKGHWEALGE